MPTKNFRAAYSSLRKKFNKRRLNLNLMKNPTTKLYGLEPRPIDNSPFLIRPALLLGTLFVSWIIWLRILRERLPCDFYELDYQ